MNRGKIKKKNITIIIKGTNILLNIDLTYLQQNFIKKLHLYIRATSKEATVLLFF